MNFDKIKSSYLKFNDSKQEIIKSDFALSERLVSKDEHIQKNLKDHLSQLNEQERYRLDMELNGFGPLELLLNDNSITEIMINAPNAIYFEKNGTLVKHSDCFFDQFSYNRFIEKICSLCQTYISAEKPFIEVQLNKWRITVVFPELARGNFLVCIRKQPDTCWTIDNLIQHKWADLSEIETIQNLIKTRKNFLVVGGTGSGKTSVLQSLIHLIPSTERTVIIEDTQELNPIHSQNASLLTRHDYNQKLCSVNMNDLVKKTLRLRPDRICVGEIRGEEATALLMALATGHDGSFGSMHARTAHEALIRLEMLIQMGAPQWSLQSIRKLIGLTIQNIIVVEKKDGFRRLQGIYEISSVEDTGITLYKL